MTLRQLDQLALRGKRVFVRVDFNVPLDKESGTSITSDTRIRMALPTIRTLLDQGCSLVLASHLGRPKGQPNARMRLAPVARRLAELLGRPVRLAPDCVGAEAEAMAGRLQSGEVLLLENLRFHSGEEANDPGFARALASLAGAYINDAFGTAHRTHASTTGVPALLDHKAAGLLMMRELENLSHAISAPARPSLGIIGGAKISGKIDVIRNLLNVTERVLIGGAMSYTFLRAQGVSTGSSLVEADRVDMARDLLGLANGRIVLPVDHVISQRFRADAPTRIVRGGVPDGWMGLDIGPKTVENYVAAIGAAELIIWNGPMGVFELKPFAAGTVAVARAVDESSKAAFSVVGGGDSERAIRVAGVGDNISHISTGGGASLDFLAGKTLPGVEALR